jgi:hypothetical protein
MRKIITIALIASMFASCGSAKHKKCDAYGNKSGSLKTETNEKRS